MLSQALAASRYSSREETFGAYDSKDELSEEEEEEDPELLSLTEDAGGVKDLAIGDWARNRFLDGHWYSPADQWYNHTVPDQPRAVRAIHPIPWDPDAVGGGVSPGPEDEQQPEVHPRMSTVHSEVPPSFQLCEQAYLAFRKQTRLILLPAMMNIVRRIVIEATADGAEPTVRIARMKLEDVVEHLRDSFTWYKGIDWLERRANVRREQRIRDSQAANQEQATAKEDADDSSVSSKSSDSHTTSPVLSTSTLQTTPSPPPSASGERKAKGVVKSRELPIPVSPVLENPVLLHPIPYIPVSIAHLPQYSVESLKAVWREACAPLYHCRCRICERATIKENQAAGNGAIPTSVQTPSPQKAVRQPQVPYKPLSNQTTVTEIVLEEAPVPELDEVVQEIYSEEDAEGEVDVDDDQIEEISSLEFEESVKRYATPTARKRPSEEVYGSDDDDEAGEPNGVGGGWRDGQTRSSSVRSRGREGTPPKRARTEETRTGSDSSHPSSPLPSPSLSPSRKRGSEELDLLSESSGSSKRNRVDGNERDEDGDEGDEDVTLKLKNRSKKAVSPNQLTRGVKLRLRTPPPPASLSARQTEPDANLESGI